MKNTLLAVAVGFAIGGAFISGFVWGHSQAEPQVTTDYGDSYSEHPIDGNYATDGYSPIDGADWEE